MADRLVVLRDGVVQQIGTPDEVYAHPANRYVAGFMGYRNMLDFDVESARRGIAVLASEGVRLTGMTFGPIEAKRAVAAIRPEDIVVDGPPRQPSRGDGRSRRVPRPRAADPGSDARRRSRSTSAPRSVSPPATRPLSPCRRSAFSSTRPTRPRRRTEAAV